MFNKILKNENKMGLRIHIKRYSAIHIILILCFLFVLVVSWFAKDNKAKDRERVDNLMQTGAFAIGYTEARKFAFRRKSVETLRVHFTVDDEKYAVWFSDVTNRIILSKEAENYWLWGKGQSGHFLVIYDENDPNNAVIRLDSPIRDSTDFVKYVEMFIKSPSTKN